MARLSTSRPEATAKNTGLSVTHGAGTGEKMGSSSSALMVPFPKKLPTALAMLISMELGPPSNLIKSEFCSNH